MITKIRVWLAKKIIGKMGFATNLEFTFSTDVICRIEPLYDGSPGFVFSNHFICPKL